MQDHREAFLWGLGAGAVGAACLWGLWSVAKVLQDSLPAKVERAPEVAPRGRAAPRSATLFQIYAPKGCPVSVSPFCGKVEAFLKLADIKYTSSDRTGSP
jgi:hypothetical protein